MRVRILDPVIFTDGGGPEGPDELHAPYFPAIGEYHLQHNLGTVPVVVWCTFFDNLSAITAFRSVIAENQDVASLKLRVSAQPGQVGRIRLLIYALAE